jgi:hypothetical protein
VAASLISTVTNLAKYDIAIDRNIIYSPQAKLQIWTPGVSPAGRRFLYGLGWFVFEYQGGRSRLPWHYARYTRSLS